MPVDFLKALEDQDASTPSSTPIAPTSPSAPRDPFLSALEGQDRGDRGDDFLNTLESPEPPKPLFARPGEDPSVAAERESYLANLPKGPESRIEEGIGDIRRGEYAKGGVKAVGGLVEGVLPAIAGYGAVSAVTAPFTTAAEIGGGAALEYGTRKGLEAVGATPEQAELGGMVAGFAPIVSTVSRGYNALKGAGSRFGGGRSQSSQAASAATEPAVRPPDVTPPPDTQPPIPIRTAPAAPDLPPRVEAVPAAKAGTRDLSTEQATDRLNSLLRDLESDDFLARATADQVRNLGMEAEGLARYLQLKKGQDPQGQFEFAEQRAGRAVRGMTPADQPLEAPGLQIRTPDPVQGRLPTEDLSSRLAAGDKAARDITTTEDRAWTTAIRKAEREGAENVPWDFEVRVRQGKPIPAVDEVVAEAQRKAAEAGGPWDFLAGTKTGQPFPALPAGASDKVKARIAALRQRIAASEAPLATERARQELLPWISNYIDNPPTVATYQDPRVPGRTILRPEGATQHVGEPLTKPDVDQLVRPPSSTEGVLLASPETAASTRAALKRVVARMDKYDAEYRKLLDRRQFADSESELKRIDERIAANRKARNVTPEQEDAIRRQLDELEAFTPEDLQLAAVESTTKPKPKRGYQSRFATEPGPYQREEFAASIPRYGPEGRLQDPSVPGVRPSGPAGSTVRGLAPAAVRGVEGGGAQVQPTGPQAVPPGSKAGAAPPPEVPSGASGMLPAEAPEVGPVYRTKKGKKTTAPIWTRGAPSGVEAGRYSPQISKRVYRARDIGEYQAAEAAHKLDQAQLNDLSTEEQRNLMQAGQRLAAPINGRVARLVEVAREVTDELAEVARRILPGDKPIYIRAADGSHYAFSKRADYMPHHIPSVDVLADKSNTITQEIMTNMVEIGVPGVRNVDDAAAMIDSWVNWMETGKNPERIVQHMIATGQAQTEAQAINRLKFMQKAAEEKPRIQGSLERERVVDLPFWDPNGTRVLHNYVREGYARLAHIKEFGQMNEELDRMIMAVRSQNGNEAADRLQKVVDTIMGKSAKDSRGQNLSSAIRTFNAFKITPVTAVPNMFQASLFGLLKTDFPTVFKAIVKSAVDSTGTKIRALRSGAFTETTLRQILAEEGITDPTRLQRWLNTWMNINTFAWSERTQRRIAQTMGEEWAQKLVTRMYENLNNPDKFRRSMERFTEISHTDPAELLARLQQAKREGIDPRKVLTDSELLMSGKRMSDILNFRSSAIDNPVAVDSPFAKVIWQFKNYLYHSTRMQYNEIARSVNEGFIKDGKWVGKPNEETWRAIRNVGALLTVFPASGAVITYLRDVLRHGPEGAMESWDESTDNPFKAYLRAAGQAGVMSAATSMLEAASYGKMTETAAGPALGQTFEGLEAGARDINRFMEKSGKEARPYSLAQFLVKNFPAVGGFIYPHLKDQIKDAIQGGGTGTPSRRGRGRSGRPSRRSSR